MKLNWALGITAFVATASALAAGKASKLPEMSHSLEGVVNDEASMPFACSFGNYEVKDAKETSLGIEAQR